MRNDEFGPYYGSHSRKNKVWTQKNVDTNKSITLKFRVNKALNQKIEDKCQEKNKKFSVLNWILWEAYFEVEKNIAWQKEIEEWEKKPKLKQVI